MINGKKILVTGGAGFIGSNLCDRLLELGNDVVCLDNFATGKLENIADALQNTYFKLIEGDIRDIATCMEAAEGCDFVLHHAALGSVPRSVKDPATTNDVNITEFLNMLIAARDRKVKRVVYASSSSVYGNSPVLPKVEGNIGKPLSPYAVTKYVDELYADVFAKTYGMEIIGLRYFNVFGKRQDPDGAYAAVIPLFVKKLLAHERPVINGDGSFSRDFTHIENVVQVNLKALATGNPKAVNQAYNVACGEQTTLNELAGCLVSGLAALDPDVANVGIDHGPVRVGDIPHSLADISKASELLGYRPEVLFKDGISQIIEWYYDSYRKDGAVE